jgi:hypothetical protein
LFEAGADFLTGALEAPGAGFGASLMIRGPGGRLGSSLAAGFGASLMIRGPGGRLGSSFGAAAGVGAASFGAGAEQLFRADPLRFRDLVNPLLCH